MKVGITVIGTSSSVGEVIWNNGLYQNVVYLAMLLERLPEISEVVLVNCGDFKNTHPISSLFGWKSISLENSLDYCDLIVELGARAINEVHYDRLKKRGAKIVSYVAGNTCIMDCEHLQFGIFSGSRKPAFEFDEVWVTPQHWETNEKYLKMNWTSKTFKIPHIWDPACVRYGIAVTNNKPFRRKRKSFRIGCFDPSINVVKSFHMPFLICEEAYRRRKRCIESLSMFGILQFQNDKYLTDMFKNSRLRADNRLFGESRHNVTGILSSHIDIIVTHHWQNGLNYLFWDALYCGIPLIHNSEFIKEAGFFYKQWDAHAGADALEECVDAARSANLSGRKRDLEALWAFSVENPEVQNAHRRRLEALF